MPICTDLETHPQYILRNKSKATEHVFVKRLVYI